MNVTLNPELEKRIEDEVNSGRSVGPDEFLNRAVYHYLFARDLGEEYTPEEIETIIAEVLDDLGRGDTAEGEYALRQLRDYSAERRGRGARTSSNWAAAVYGRLGTARTRTPTT